MKNAPMNAAAWIAGTCLSGILPSTALAAAPLPHVGLFQWEPFLGPFHSVVLHFPIGFVVMAFLVDLAYLRRRSADSQRIVGLILVFTVLASVLTIFLGLMRSGSAEYDPQALSHHRNFGMAVGALMVATLAFHHFAFREGGRDPSRGVLRLGFRASLLASMIVMIIAGHQGGNLTHGTNYLTKNAPQFVKDLIEETPDLSGESGTTAANAGEQFFAENVKPILDTKCAGCHGAEKQKGEYRLDQKAIALKGGESGKIAIKPGEPLQSHLIDLVLLPPDDDEVMPPQGKRGLTPDEVMTLIRWIQQGAPFPEAAEIAPLAGAEK